MTRIVDTLRAAIPGRTPSSDTADDPDEASIQVSVDEATRILKDSRRRWIIQDLDEHGESTIGELADRRSRLVYGTEYSSTERKREYVSMYQTHLPRLDDADVVAFDPRRSGHTVNPGPRLDGFVAALEALDALCNSDAQTAGSREVA